MNAEQKQRALQLLRRFDLAVPMTRQADNAAVAMAALLQELIDAPEPEPVARVTGYYAGYLSIETADGRVLPAGTALYAAPPHQSEHHLEMVNPPAPSVPDAGLARDAERYRWLRTYNTAKHPAVTEAFFLGDENLDAEIDAAIAAKKGGAP